MKTKISILLLAVSAALYLASLSLPALMFAEHAPLSGLHILGWGWWGLLTFDPGWLANLAYFATLVFMGMRFYSAALIASSFAVLLGMTSFLAKEWWFHEGYPTPIAALGTGFYVWLIGFVLACLSAFLAWRTGTGKALI